MSDNDDDRQNGISEACLRSGDAGWRPPVGADEDDIARIHVPSPAEDYDDDLAQVHVPEADDEEMVARAQERCERSQARHEAKVEPHPLGEGGAELLDSVWHHMMVNHAKANGIPIGKARCSHCLQVRNWGDEPTCTCEVDIERNENTSIRRQRADAAIESIIPEGMTWAQFGTEEWAKVEAKEPRMRDFARRWNRDAGCTLILGPTGSGKTAACVALLIRILNRSANPKETDKNARWAYRMKFIDAAELVVARRNSRLGGEADLIDQAKGASLLVLDELGFETLSPIPFEVVNARYLTGSPTIITSGRKRTVVNGRTVDEFAKRYGAAFMRRITDRGNVINLWEKASS